MIHTVGTLFGTGGPQRTYKALNRDAAVNMADSLNSFGQQRNFVMISSEKAPPIWLMAEYQSRKMEAEQYIIKECKFLKPSMIRPGFIVDREHRIWSVALGAIQDLQYCIETPMVKYLPGGKYIDFLVPAKSTQLSTVAHFSILGALGQNEN